MWDTDECFSRNLWWSVQHFVPSSFNDTFPVWETNPPFNVALMTVKFSAPITAPYLSGRMFGPKDSHMMQEEPKSFPRIQITEEERKESFSLNSLNWDQDNTGAATTQWCHQGQERNQHRRGRSEAWEQRCRERESWRDESPVCPQCLGTAPSSSIVLVSGPHSLNNPLFSLTILNWVVFTWNLQNREQESRKGL